MRSLFVVLLVLGFATVAEAKTAKQRIVRPLAIVMPKASAKTAFTIKNPRSTTIGFTLSPRIAAGNMTYVRSERPFSCDGQRASKTLSTGCHLAQPTLKKGWYGCELDMHGRDRTHVWQASIAPTSKNQRFEATTCWAEED